MIRSSVSIFQRAGRRKLYARVKGVDGAWKQIPTPYSIGQEAEAKAWAEKLAERTDAARAAGATSGPLTVARYAEAWLAERKRQGLDHGNDRQRLRDHVLPVVGSLPLADVRARHLVALVADIRAAGTMAPRTLRNVYAVISALLRDAELAGLIERAPAKLTKHQLGPVADADPTTREDAVFARFEVEALIADVRIPLDRQALYALGALAGLRHGEIAALRWRHVDTAREPLGMLTIAASNAKTRTKTGIVRRVPILPALAGALVDWRLAWPEAFGRQPGPDDLVVPLELDPPKKQARPNPRAGGMRNSHDTETRRDRDLAALGLRHRTTHDLRATFVTLAEDAGVPSEIVAKLTHTARSRAAYAGYSRTQWDTLCRELARLDLRREAIAHRGDAVVTLTQASVITVGKWRSGRDSNTAASTLGDARRKHSRHLALVGSPSSSTGSPPASPSLGDAIATTCDVGLAALRAASRQP